MTRGYGNFLGFVGDWVRFAKRSDVAYRTLGVSESADDAEIEQAYLRLMAQYRPERLAGLAESIRRSAQKKAVEIDTAYGRIRTLRKRHAQRHTAPESPRAVMTTSDDRRKPGELLWVALALIALMTVAWLASPGGRWTPAPPQARVPAPNADPGDMPVSRPPAGPSVVAPPGSSVDPPASPALPPPVAATAGDMAPVERMVTLMPKDPPQASRAPPGPSGEAGLVEALRAGQLRPATGADFSRWALRWSEANRRSLPADFQGRSGSMTSYVIQKDFTIPEGLNGAHAVIFLLDTRVPYPHGSPGHSVILDLSSGACMGVTCGMLLD